MLCSIFKLNCMVLYSDLHCFFKLFLHYILLFFQIVKIIGGGGETICLPPPPNILIGGDCPPPPPPPIDASVHLWMNLIKRTIDIQQIYKLLWKSICTKSMEELSSCDITIFWQSSIQRGRHTPLCIITSLNAWLSKICSNVDCWVCKNGFYSPSTLLLGETSPLTSEINVRIIIELNPQFVLETHVCLNTRSICSSILLISAKSWILNIRVHIDKSLFRYVILV